MRVDANGNPIPDESGTPAVVVVTPPAEPAVTPGEVAAIVDEALQPVEERQEAVSLITAEMLGDVNRRVDQLAETTTSSLTNLQGQVAEILARLPSSPEASQPSPENPAEPEAENPNPSDGGGVVVLEVPAPTTPEPVTKRKPKYRFL